MIGMDDETLKDILGTVLIIVAVAVVLNAASVGTLSPQLITSLSPLAGIGAALIVGGGALAVYFRNQ